MVKKQEKSPVSYKNNLVNFTASLMNYYNLKSEYETHPLVDYLLTKRYRHIVVMLLDGLSMDTIENNTDNGSILRTHQIMRLNTVFPPTTVAATAALQTGKAPIESGWLGWHLYFDDTNPSVELFSNKDYYSEEPFTGFKISDYLDNTSWYSQIKRNQIYEIHPSFKEGGFENFNDAVDKLEEIIKKEEHNFTYFYWDKPDYTMHEYGAKSPVVKVELQQIEERLVQLAENLPNNTCIFLLADHGLVNVEEINLEDYKMIKNMLRKPISGEGRFTQFYVKNEMKETFCEMFNSLFGENFKLYTKKEFIASHLAGLHKAHPTTEYTLGDYCAVATSNYMFINDDSKFHFAAHHAGLTTAELDIPVILFKRKDETVVEE